jgi:hypothetical protein
MMNQNQIAASNSGILTFLALCSVDHRHHSDDSKMFQMDRSETGTTQRHVVGTGSTGSACDAVFQNPKVMVVISVADLHQQFSAADCNFHLRSFALAEDHHQHHHTRRSRESLVMSQMVFRLLLSPVFE